LDGVVTEEYVRTACEASLRRLGTDYIDLYQFHWSDYDPELAIDLVPILEDLVSEGKIRWYGWSTGYPKRAKIFASGEHCTSIQYNYNLLERNTQMQALCDELDLASIARGPLGMGLLTGKYTHNSEIAADDVRAKFWNLKDGWEGEELEMLAEIHEILQQDGCTLAQAALRWLWARGDQIMPIPGLRSQEQVVENIQVMQYGPLSEKQLQKIDDILQIDQQPGKFEITAA
jgi:aryl-alcohol dehydrogenase-like predicted oxidoreductase